MSLKKRVRNYLPSTGNFSLVGTDRLRPQPDLRAHWPIRLTQIIGGKRWSLSFVWHKTPHPVLTELGEEWVRVALEGKELNEVSADELRERLKKMEKE